MLSKLSVGEPMEGTWLVSLQEKSIAEDICVTDITKDWTQPIKDYILEEKLASDEKIARKIRTTPARYVLIDDQLYRTMGTWSLLNCVNVKDGKYVLWEIHEGIYGSHIGTEALVKKALRYGYY